MWRSFDVGLYNYIHRYKVKYNKTPLLWHYYIIGMFIHLSETHHTEEKGVSSWVVYHVLFLWPFFMVRYGNC